MGESRIEVWLRRLRAAATFTFGAALALSVALLVIALIPGSPVTQELPAGSLRALDSVRGVSDGVAVDPAGWVPFAIHDPSLAQRLLHLLTMLPSLLVIAEIARRTSDVLRAAEASDPFTSATARALIKLGKITALAGLGAWLVGQVAAGLLSRTMLDSPGGFEPDESPLVWLVLGLIFAGFGLILNRGVEMRDELDTVI